jgi:hypothetical protein
MQQAYVNAFTHLRQFNGSAQFSTWLTRIAINEALARVRRRGRYETFDDDLSNVEPFMSTNPVQSPERQAFAGELRGLLEWAIDTLPDGMREVFVLRDVEGLSTAEVAESLALTAHCGSPGSFPSASRSLQGDEARSARPLAVSSTEEVGRRFEHAGEIQMAYRRQRCFPPALGAESTDTRILVRRECGTQAGRAHRFGQNRRGVCSL